MKKLVNTIIRKKTESRLKEIKSFTGLNEKEIILIAMKRIIKKHEANI